MAEKKKKRVADSINQINVTPMVDVMLVLLVIFMVITPMLSKGVSVDMVKTRNPIAMEEADKEDALVVAITPRWQSVPGTRAGRAGTTGYRSWGRNFRKAGQDSLHQE